MTQQKSQALKLFEGHVDKAQLRPNPTPTNAPKKPRQLSKEASKLWDKLIPQLEALALATAIDETMLVGLVNWWARYNQAESNLAGVTDLSTTQGARALNAVKVCWSEYRRLAELFGITPVARSSIHVEPPKQDDLESLKL